MRLSGSIVIGVVGAVLVCAGAHAQYERHYFDEARRLVLDTSRVAVLPGAGGVEAALRAAGIGDAGVSALAGGWRLVSAPAGARSPDGIEGLVESLASESGVFASPVFVDGLGGPLIVTPDILLRFEEGVEPGRAETIASGAGDVLESDWAGMPRAYKLRAASLNGFEVLEAANALAERDGVRFAEPDFLFTGHAVGEMLPDDPLFPDQWGMHNTGQFIGCGYGDKAVPGFDIDAPEAWDVTTGDGSITVVIIDTGVQLDHPDLLLDPSLGHDVTSDGGDGGPVNGCDNHGTVVAGRAGGLLNDLGMVGVAPDCSLASVRTFISKTPPNVPECNGQWMSQASWTVAALFWAHETIGARVTNNSSVYGFTSSAIEDKYAQTRAEGVVHFAATGNAGASEIGYPSSIESVNAIGMTGPAGILNANSNYGPGLAFVAPGAAVTTTDRTGAAGWSEGDHLCGSGTSFASPTAAGVAALVLSIDPTLTPDAVEQIMRDSVLDMGEPGYDIMHGWGMVNAAGAVQLAQGCPADVNGDGELNVLDFVAFQAEWASQTEAGDCDGNGSYDVLDFVCFQGIFQAGCP